MFKNDDEWYFNSGLLIVGCMIGMIFGVPIFLIYGFGVFIDPLTEALQAGRGEVSLALTIGLMGNLIAAPLVGILSDRFGSSRMVLIGVICLSVTLASYSFIQNLTQLYLISLAMVLFAGGTGPMTYTKIVSAWFNKRRGLALGIVLAGMGIGAAIMPVLSQALIGEFGWRLAYRYLGLIVFIVSFLPLFLILKDRPPNELARSTIENLHVNQPTAKDEEGYSVGTSLKTPTFWFIAIGFFLIAVGNSGGLVHLSPMLVDAGLTAEKAALYVGLMGVGVLFGRAIAGYLLDIFHAPYVAICFLAGPILAYAFFLSGMEPGFAVVPILLFGIGMGAEFDVIPFLISRYFGLKNFGVLFGFQIVSFSLGTGFGPAIMGFGFDKYGSYNITLISAMASLMLGCLLVSRLGNYNFSAEVKASVAQ